MSDNVQTRLAQLHAMILDGDLAEAASLCDSIMEQFRSEYIPTEDGSYNQ